MPEIEKNQQLPKIQAPYEVQQSRGSQQYGYYSPAMVESKSARDEFVTEHRKNGLVERVYNGIKNLTGLGIGSKKALEAVEKAENGEITEDQAKEAIKKYRNSQANSAQIAGDAVSIGFSMFGIRKMGGFLKRKNTYQEKAPIEFLKREHGIYKSVKKKTGVEKLKSEGEYMFSRENLIEFFEKPTKRTILLALGFAISTGLVKTLFGLVNRIGAHEFYTDKKDFNGAVNPYDKAAYAQVKKYNRKERHHAGWRNFFSGAINAVTLPITGLVGGIVGVPAYFVLNTLNRHFIGNHEENRNFKGYFDNLKNDGILNAGLALGLGIPAFLKTHNMSVVDKASRMAVNELKGIKFNHQNYYNWDDSTIKQVTKIIMDDKEISNIINKSTDSMLTDEELRTLADELSKKNIFAAKLKQISNDGSALSRILKEDLEPTRNAEQAQEYINKVFGEGTYTLVDDHYCLGVGTVAETYFAKTKTGEEVCIKALKEGLNEQKLKADAEAFKNMINGTTGISAAEKEQLKKNVDNLYEGVKKEIDLQNEFKAAEKLAKSTKFAKVVKGITVKDNVYVMERAQGISLESLINLTEAQAMIDNIKKMQEENGNFLQFINSSIAVNQIEKNAKDGSPVRAILQRCRTTEQALKELKKYQKRVQSRSPMGGNFRLTPDDMRNLIVEYQQVLVEQFNKIDAGGKVIHGDIHPGNIFVDYNALVSMKTPSQFDKILNNMFGFKPKMKNHNVFTLIDTGNIIELNAEQSMSLLNLSSYIEHGNYQKIAEYVMQGVEGEALGKHTKDSATKIISDELKKCFTDKNIALDVMTNENMLKLTSGIMRANGIVPNETQLNLNKAIQSANNSYESIISGLVQGRYGEAKIIQNAFGFGEATKDGTFIKQIKSHLEKEQEKDNLRRLPASERLKLKNLEGNLKPDQKEYYIYKYKQELYQVPDDVKIGQFSRTLRSLAQNYMSLTYETRKDFDKKLNELVDLLETTEYKTLKQDIQEDVMSFVKAINDLPQYSNIHDSIERINKAVNYKETTPNHSLSFD